MQQSILNLENAITELNLVKAVPGGHVHAVLIDIISELQLIKEVYERTQKITQS